VSAFDCLGDPARRRILGPLVGSHRATDEAGAAVPDKHESGVSRSTRGCCATMHLRSSGPAAPKVDLSSLPEPT
jgi:hypothetical protein